MRDPPFPSKFPDITDRGTLYNSGTMSNCGRTMYRAIFSCLAAAALIVTTANSVPAMTTNGCAGGACTDCHSLSRQEAVRILGNNVDNVQSIDMSPVKGLWEVAVEKDGKRWPLYIDFSKEYVVAGHIVQVSTKENLTGSRMLSMNRIDVSQIPLGGSILLGKMDAKHRIVVFDDPGCTYCARLHETAKGLPAGKCDGRSLDE